MQDFDAYHLVTVVEIHDDPRRDFLCLHDLRVIQREVEGVSLLIDLEFHRPAS